MTEPMLNSCEKLILKFTLSRKFYLITFFLFFHRISFHKFCQWKYECTTLASDEHLVNWYTTQEMDVLVETVLIQNKSKPNKAIHIKVENIHGFFHLPIHPFTHPSIHLTIHQETRLLSIGYVSGIMLGF